MTRPASEIACGVNDCRVGPVEWQLWQDIIFSNFLLHSHTMCRDKHTLLCCTSTWRCISMGFCVLLSGSMFCLLPSSFQYSSHFSHSDYTTIQTCTNSKHSTCFYPHSWLTVPTAHTFGVSIFFGTINIFISRIITNQSVSLVTVPRNIVA
jgi:hypothetical protein